MTVIASRDAILLALVASDDGPRAPGNMAVRAQEIADAGCAVFGHAIIHGYGAALNNANQPLCARCGRVAT